MQHVCVAGVAGQVKGFMAARANKDALASHINEVVARKAAASEMGEFDTPRSNITGFTGAGCKDSSQR